MHCNSSQFSYDGKTKTFTAESSDIAPLRDFYWTPFVNDIDGTLCQGLVFRSLRTGVEIRYFIAETEMDANDEEIMAYILRPLNEDVMSHPTASGTSIFLIND